MMHVPLCSASVPAVDKALSLYQGKYRVESTRLKGWDYTRAGWYFVTLCTRERNCYFGTITNGLVSLSPSGQIVAEEWQRTPVVRPNVELDYWVMMPNHLHGIVVIKEAEPGALLVSRARPLAASQANMAPGTLKSGSLGAIVGQIKSICKKRIRAAGISQFDWQPRFYDHIIRDDRALAKIREYISNNSAQWELDDLNPDHS